MYVTSEKKKEIFKTFGKTETNTGSVESQVALFTARILHLSDHMKTSRNDKFTKRSLVNLVGKRRKLLDYLKERDVERYRAILKELNLRK